MGLEPSRLERGKRARSAALKGGESGLDWTKDLDYAAELSRHLRHRPVAAALSHDPDGGGPPGPEGLGSLKPGTLPSLSANGPPAAGSIPSLSQLARSRLLIRPSTTRQLQGPVRVRSCQPARDASVTVDPANGRHPQGPDCVRARRLGVAASADPANGPTAAGSGLCLNLPARRCCPSRSRHRRATLQGPTEFRVWRLGGQVSVDPVNGPSAAGTRLCPSQPARGCYLVGPVNGPPAAGS